MQCTISQLNQETFGTVLNVYEVFKNFFGESFVDLQGIPDEDSIIDDICSITGYEQIERDVPFEIDNSTLRRVRGFYERHYFSPFILVHWPYVTVTNENNRSVQIQDLYAKVKVCLNGTIPYEYRGFTLCRTTFPKEQYLSHYLHSHTPSFYGVPSFENPCLGTGPINNTIMDLKNTYEEALWMLFCQELALYVTVESLSGGPYIRMESIGSIKPLRGYADYSHNNSSYSDICFSIRRNYNYNEEAFKTILVEFIHYYLKHGHLSLNFNNGSYDVGMPYFDYMVDISNAFIDFCNIKQDISLKKCLVQCLAANNRFYSTEDSGSTNAEHTISTVEGSEMFLFKGEMQHLHITQGAEEQFEITHILNNSIAMYILNSILKTINYRYKNEYNKRFFTADSSTPTCQKVYYI